MKIKNKYIPCQPIVVIRKIGQRWPPEPKVVGSSPSWRTRLNLIFSIQRLPISEAFVVCMNGQMWTKRDKNRTQKLPGVYGTFSIGSLLFFLLQKFSDPFIFCKLNSDVLLGNLNHAALSFHNPCCCVCGGFSDVIGKTISHYTK